MNKKPYKRKEIALSADEKTKLEHINKYRIMTDTEVPEEKYVFSVNGVGCMPLGDLAAIKAKPKQGKSTAIKWIVGALFGGKAGSVTGQLKDTVVLWLDTEQSSTDVKLIIKDIRKISGVSKKYIDAHLNLYTLRKADCKEIIDEIETAIKHYQPKMVILDGIAEFIDSVNDEKEAKLLVNKFMQISSEFNCATICVLHENRNGSNDMKGHLGAQLAQKVAIILECNKNGDTITIKCTESRHQSVPAWSIRFDEQGNIINADDYVQPLRINARPTTRPNKKQIADEKEKLDRLNICLDAIQENGGSINKKTLRELLQNKKNISRPTATNLLSEFIKNNKLFVDGNNISALPKHTDAA